MRARTRISAAVAIFTTLIVATSGVVASADTPRNGNVTVVLNAPDGVPANVSLAKEAGHGGDHDSKNGRPVAVVAKHPEGTRTSQTLILPAGEYQVKTSAVQWDGVRYFAKRSTSEIKVKARAGAKVTVTFVPDGGARELHMTEASVSGGLSLAWEGPPGASYALRRATGAIPPSGPTAGRKIPVTGLSAVDTNVTPGAVYSYALFTRRKGASTWVGPVTVSGSVSAATGASATYVAAPTTFIAKVADVASVLATPEGLEVTFASGVPVPYIGAAVVLPIMGDLDAGYLGTVLSLSSDGRTVVLRPDGLAAAFDYYELDVPDISAIGNGSAPAAKTTATVIPSVGTELGNVKPKDPAQWDEYRNSRSKHVAAPNGTAESAGAKTGAMAASAAQAAPPPSRCGKANIPNADFADFQPSITPSGHFSTKVNKWGPVPKSAEVNLGAQLTVTGALEAKVAAEYKCSLPLPNDIKMITTSPVPIALKWELVAQVTIGGALEMSNFGVTATAGFDATAKLSPSVISATGGPTLSMKPLIPVIKSGSVEVAAKLGGAITLGPGAGVKTAGAIAGIRAEVNLLDLKGSFFPPVNQAFCASVSVAASFDVLLTARAWLGPWSGSADFPLFNKALPFPGSPYDQPKGCKSAPPTPTDVLGPGVTKQTDNIVGVPGQQGYSEGLIPGQKTWVLSTGLLSDAVGDPASFASTDLQTAGDDDLTAKAGYPTFDAAAYEVTVVPSGSMLHVKYLFASEEYPEWVDSGFNDVMAVYVDGANCAVVPGSNTPVTVNTINASTNSAFYVDNTSGAAGYNTAYDGLTLPLTCNVPVVPGKAVNVKIAVADGSDHVLDSAVALVQQGIWSD